MYTIYNDKPVCFHCKWVGALKKSYICTCPQASKFKKKVEMRDTCNLFEKVGYHGGSK